MKALLNTAKILTISLLICACHILDDGVMSGPPRYDSYNRNDYKGDVPPADTSKPVIIDTSIYYVGVNFDDSYDWREDKEPDKRIFSVDMYLNHSLKLSLNSQDHKISSDPDTHHIINGNLYTELSNKDSTYFSRNGEIVVRFEGRELLKGVLEYNGDLYTLSCNRDEEGLKLRKNGQVVFYRTEGYVFGSLIDPSYAPTGAVYIDGEDVCFCYYLDTSSSRRCFSVRNCKEKEITLYMTIDDMKCIEGRDVYSYRTEFTQDNHIWRGPPVQISSYYFSNNQWNSGITSGLGAILCLTTQKSDILIGDTLLCATYENDVGSIVINCTNYPIIKMRQSEIPNTLLMSESCMSICQDLPIIALCSRDNNTNYLFINDKISEIGINGYISRVAIEITSTN